MTAYPAAPPAGGYSGGAVGKQTDGTAGGVTWTCPGGLPGGTGRREGGPGSP
ncbi:MAG: hypothetical protein QOJ21_3808 [Solirubrobacteraceae bacterium]|jgi:hypothetical protein|nr:hypothetical protein [Solirubrobacteraceae bacterium]